MDSVCVCVCVENDKNSCAASWFVNVHMLHDGVFTQPTLGQEIWVDCIATALQSLVNMDAYLPFLFVKKQGGLQPN